MPGICEKSQAWLPGAISGTQFNKFSSDGCSVLFIVNLCRIILWEMTHKQSCFIGPKDILFLCRAPKRAIWQTPGRLSYAFPLRETSAESLHVKGQIDDYNRHGCTATEFNLCRESLQSCSVSFRSIRWRGETKPLRLPMGICLNSGWVGWYLTAFLL